MGFFKLTKWKILFAFLLLAVIGIGFFVWDYNRHIHLDPVIQSLLNGPPGQPQSREEAQKRVNFTILRPTYKPVGLNENGRLILFGNDQFAKVNYDTRIDYANSTNRDYGLQLEETKATSEQIAKVSKEGIVANDPYATNIRQIDVCGSAGYIGISKASQEIIFIKDGTRVLLTYFTPMPVNVTPFIPLTDQEILQVACSLQPIVVSK